VSPAWQRYAITRLALAERRWLCDELAARGHTANSVIVSDDDNLDIAAEYGFPTVERDNSDLGERFNAGYKYAADQGADLIVMGIYGHSRLRELVLGGVSRTLLGGMTVPLFMAH